MTKWTLDFWLLLSKEGRGQHSAGRVGYILSLHLQGGVLRWVVFSVVTLSCLCALLSELLSPNTVTFSFQTGYLNWR